MDFFNRTILTAVFCILVSIPSLSAQDAAVSSGHSVGEFLTPDGRFDLEAARRAGFQGSLKGQPVFRHTSSSSSAEDPDDIYWNKCMSSSIPGTDGKVTALTVYNGKLVAAETVSLGDGFIYSYVAEWSGLWWNTLGVMFGSNYSFVYALTVYKGTLIAGGWFSSAGGTSTNCIAAWDGSSWSPLGSGMEGSVYALTVYDGKLIAGGGFTIAGGTSANCIAAWDGSSWSPLGEGIRDDNNYSYVFALTEYDGKLIAGGNFTNAGGVSADYIAAWDGSSWSPLGSGLNGGGVLAITQYDGKLVPGGWFDSADGVSTKNIAAWDGSSWSHFDLGVGYGVYGLSEYDGKLITCGYDLEGTHCIAAWDGSSWSPSGGMDDYVSALMVYDEELVAGGYFNTAGGKDACFIASWTNLGPNGVSEQSILPAGIHLSQNFPNPFNPSTTIDFSIPDDSRVVLKIHNIVGQEVATLKNEIIPAGRHLVVWDAKGMPSGIYFYTVKAGTFVKTGRMVLLK